MSRSILALAKLQMLLLAMFAGIGTRPRVAQRRRGAEFLEVALYASIILVIVFAFRQFLPDAFDELLGRVRDSLTDNPTG